MKKLSTLVAFLTAALFVSFVDASKKQMAPPVTETTTDVVDLTGFTAFIPCTGETVTFSGNLIIVNHVTINGTRVNSKTLFNPQNLVGISTSGETYHGAGNSHFQASGSLINGQVTLGLVNNFLLIGTASAESYKIHESLQITVNANGTVTASTDNLNITCH